MSADPIGPTFTPVDAFRIGMDLYDRFQHKELPKRIRQEFRALGGDRQWMKTGNKKAPTGYVWTINGQILTEDEVRKYVKKNRPPPLPTEPAEPVPDDSDTGVEVDETAPPPLPGEMQPWWGPNQPEPPPDEPERPFIPTVPELKPPPDVVSAFVGPVPVLDPVAVPVSVPTIVGTVIGRAAGVIGAILFPSETAPPELDVPAPAPPQRTPPFVPDVAPFPDFEDFSKPPWLLPEQLPGYRGPIPDPRTFPRPDTLPQPLPEPQPQPRPYPYRFPIDEPVIVEAPRPADWPEPYPYGLPEPYPGPVEAPEPYEFPTPTPTPGAPGTTAPRPWSLPDWPLWLVPFLPDLSPRPRARPRDLPRDEPTQDPTPRPTPRPADRPEPYPIDLPFDVPFDLPLPFLPPDIAPPGPATFRPPQNVAPREPVLTPFQDPGVGYDPVPFDLPQPLRADSCSCTEVGKKPRKPRKPRTVCYSGTFREYARGTFKLRKKRVSCQRS